MARKTAKLTVFYIIGLAAASFLGSFAGVYIGAAIFLIGAVSALLSKRLYSVKLFSAAFGVGLIVWSAFFGINYETAMLYNGAEAEITGTVTDINEFSGGRAIYTVDGKLGGVTPAIVTAFISEGNNRAEIGDTISISGKLTAQSNSYTFAAADINTAKGIFLQYKNVTEIVILSQNNNVLTSFSDTVKSRIYTVSGEHLNASQNALFKAMLFGDRDGISDTKNTIFSRAGVSHIMAVSGAQLSIICSLAVVLLEALKIGRFRRFFICLFLIGFFVLICENSVSITRAAVMIIITFAVPLINRQSDTATSLAISAIILTLQNPFIIRDAAFLLSAGGVLAVAVIAPPVISHFRSDFAKTSGKIYRSVRDIFISSGVVSLTLFPISFFFFDEVSLLSPITNIFLIPISTLVIILGMIVVLTFGFAPTAALLFPTISLLCDLTAVISKFAAGLPFSFIPTGLRFERPLLLILIAVTLIAALLFTEKKRLRKTAAALLVSLAIFIAAFSVYQAVPDGRIYTAVLGDERAAAVVIHDKFEAVVIDIKGSGEAADYVRKYLSSQGIGDVAVLIADENAARSIPSYMKYLPEDFYDISMYAAPEETGLPAAVIFPGGEGEFYKNDGGFIEYKKAHAEFYEDLLLITMKNDETIIIAEKALDKPPPADIIIYISSINIRIRDDGKVTLIY
jgi:competence protein ComEC